MNQLSIEYWDKNLFGNDAAEEEQEEIFSSYALEREEIKHFLDENSPIQIVRAFKGEGKSALLRIVSNKLAKDKSSSIRISTTGVAISPNLESDDSDYWTREWKKNLLKLTANEIGNRIGFAFTDDAISLVEESEHNGFKQRSFVSTITERLKSKALPLEQSKKNIVNYENILKRYLDKGEWIWLIIDDVDQNFKNTEKNKIKVASFFTACRQIVGAIPEIRIRTCVRPNVWKIIKREYESLSHVEQYMHDIRWNLEDITDLLARRVQGYLERNDRWIETKRTLSDIVEVRNKQLVYLVFQDSMPWGSGNRTRPAPIVLNTLSRGRPRWLIELCKVSAKSAKDNNRDRIFFEDISNQLEEFGKRRIDDTIAEFQSQCPQIEDLITAFSQQNERYPTSELLKLITDRILQTVSPKIFGVLGRPSHKEIAHFLFQVGFITARRDHQNDEYEHISFIDQPDLLKSKTNLDDGVSWEIHPVFRQALKLKNVETKQQAKYSQRRRP
jgi:hypothetical protein